MPDDKTDALQLRSWADIAKDLPPTKRDGINGPIRLCYENDDGDWTYYCAACGHWHIHGAVEGYRVPHCGTRNAETPQPYLVLAGKLTVGVRKTRRPAWSELVRREPRLKDLLDLIRANQRQGDGYQQWYGEYKRMMSQLVGHDVVDDLVLSHSHAYDAAYRKLFHAATGGYPATGFDGNC